MGEISGFDFATVNGARVEPRRYPVLYHGNAYESPILFDQNDGLPARGNDIELIRHIEPPPGRIEESAFRGTVHYPLSPALEAGACFWAGDGGWLYEVHNYPGYDIHQMLAGRVPNGKGGFRDPLMKEQEIAIPARVIRSAVPRVGVVSERRRGFVVEWKNI